MCRKDISTNTEHIFHLGQLCVTVYPAMSADSPVVYLIADRGEDDETAVLLKSEPGSARESRDFSLVTITGFSWNDDLSPWSAPPAYKKGEPFSGGADSFLRILSEEIIPQAEEDLHPVWRGIAGYSLAGLFSLYSLYRTDLFDRAVSASGSLWYPEFDAYFSSHRMIKNPDRIYLSLGDREASTKNPVMQRVADVTETFLQYCLKQQIDAVFEYNAGGHFQDAPLRIAKGILRILE